MADCALKSLALLAFAQVTVGKRCEMPKYLLDSEEFGLSSYVKENQTVYNCPKENDPRMFTECCPDKGCCPRSISALSSIDEWLMMVTAITVICLCLVLTTGIVICCFCSKCPLYNTCRANYNTSNVIVYSLAKEDDPLSLMPLENGNGYCYTPSNVKIKKVEDV